MKMSWQTKALFDDYAEKAENGAYPGVINAAKKEFLKAIEEELTKVCEKALSKEPNYSGDSQ